MAVGIPTKELHQLGDMNFVGVNLLQHVLHGFVLPGEQIVRCLVASSGAIVNFDVQGFAERVHRVEDRLVPGLGSTAGPSGGQCRGVPEASPGP